MNRDVPPRGYRRFLLWLSLTAALLALVFAVMLVVLLRQDRSAEATAKLQGDSITALSFQLERELLRLRSSLALALRSQTSTDWEELGLRYDILLSRIELLRQNPSTLRLSARPEYQELMPRLERLILETTPLMAAPQQHARELAELLERFNELGPDMQALTTASNLVVAQLIEEQVATVRAQSWQIRWLVGAQVLILLLAAAGLLLRQRRLEREQRALQVLNAELEAAKNQAESANRSKDLFLANMSHELRTPFNGMLGMLDLIEEGRLDPDQRDHVQTAKNSAQHLLRLLNDILDMSALESGKMKITPEAVDMRSLIGDVQRLMGAQARSKGLELIVEVPAEWPDWVETDPTRVRQILFNLLSNAIKFTEHGRITLSVQCKQQADRLLDWSIAVSDTGIGMDRFKLDQLFQRFQQLDNSATRRFGGTGLGLEISRMLARLLGGDIGVSSQPGQGSTFTLTLSTPLSLAPPLLGRDETVMSGANDEGAILASSPSSLHVLVVEDHPVNRQFIGTLLDRLGHRTSYAENGRAALEILEQQTFDLILMDIHMPELDGLDTTRSLRARRDTRARIPVIALSADVMNEARERALAAGMDDFLSKPLRKAQLQQTLQRWAGQQHDGQVTQPAADR